MIAEFMGVIINGQIPPREWCALSHAFQYQPVIAARANTQNKINSQKQHREARP
jgi:hypothetical protein